MDKFSKTTGFFKKIPNIKELKKAVGFMSPKEFVVFFLLSLVMTASAVIILWKVNEKFLVEVPSFGGSLSEGVIGAPRFVNPILAISDADEDLIALIYSGLMHKENGGKIGLGLAESYSVSKDGLVYTFKLKENIYFHDGKAVTADDVVFTINAAKDSILKSPKRINWEGIAVSKIDDRTVQFDLKQPYSSFLENATLGILPSHIWKNIPPDQFSFSKYNIEAIGSGPYKIESVKTGSSGPESYSLSPFSEFELGKSFIKELTVRFYGNEKDLVSALEAGGVDQINEITPDNAEMLKGKKYIVRTAVLPRVFGLFFNQNQNQIFTDRNVIKALNSAIDRDKIVEKVLEGYGQSIYSPVPMGIVKDENSGNAIAAGNIDTAKKILADAGWKAGTDGMLEKKITDKNKKTSVQKLSFSISTSDTPELKETAEIIKEDLAKIGVAVEVKTFELGSLNQNVIRQRKYEALLFGQVITHDSDLYAFWHSSQIKDPGLNIAMYANSKVDKILENALSAKDEKTRSDDYAQLEKEIVKDQPAVFIYSPAFIYISDKNIGGQEVGRINEPSDRFLNIHKWFVETDKIWKIFNKE